MFAASILLWTVDGVSHLADRQELLAFLPSIVLLSLSATGNPHCAMGHINIIFIRAGCCMGSGGNHSLQDLSWILSVLNLELKLTSHEVTFIL